MKPKYLLFVIFITATLFRFVGLNQSLWLDEATTAKVISQFSYGDIITRFSPADFHPPLFYLLEKLWMSLFVTSWVANSEMVLRMPSVLFSLLTGYVVYLIGKKIKDEKTGLIASLLFLFNPLIMYYSQEARMYMMATFFIVSAYYFFLCLEGYKFGKLQKKNIILCNLCIALSFFTFYGSIFFISALYIYLLLKRNYRLFWLLHPGFLVSLLILAPLLYQQYLHSQTALQYVVNWRLVLGQANLKNLFLVPLKFAVGRISFYPKLVYYSLSGLWTLVVGFFFVRGFIRRKHLLFFFFFPLFLGILFSFFSPLLQYFRFLYLVPLMCLVLAVGIYDRKTVSVALVTGFILWSVAYLFLSQFHREDWKSLAADLPRRASVYMIPSSSDPLRYYRPDIVVLDIRSPELMSTPGVDRLVLPYTADIYGINLHAYLENKSLKLKETKTYRELTLEVWE